MTKPLKIGVAGLGIVGGALIRILQEKPELLDSVTGRKFEVMGVCARDRNKDRGFDLTCYEWFDKPETLAESSEIDVFVELMGGENGPARESIEVALGAGKHVVTANKALLAKHGLSLARVAEKNGVSLSYEAAVAGGIPIVKTLRESLAGNRITRVYGILNGTCNYILTRMEQDKLSFNECLADAQRIGYAEADPAFDIEGDDSAHKLILLTSLAFGTEIESESIYIEGITSITSADIEAANQLGYRIKLLGFAQLTETGIEQRVHPTMVPKNSSIANISGVLNAVAVDGDSVGGITIVGPGAGGDATASSVISDLVDIARGNSVHTFKVPTVSLKPYERARMRKHEGGYYIRLSVHDRPGVFAAIAESMAGQSISLKSIFQHQQAEDGNAGETGAGSQTQDVILITHETTEESVKTALAEIVKESFISEKPQMIRIEKTN